MPYCYYCMRDTGTQNGLCTVCGKDKNETSRKKDKNHLAPGTRVDDILVGTVLGAGGFGITYAALDTTTTPPRRIALKEFFSSRLNQRNPDGKTVDVKSNDSDSYKYYQKKKHAFEREARMLAKLHHPNIVDVFFVDSDENNTSYFGMEFLEGITLEDYLSKHGRMSMNEALQLIAPIFDALDYLHKNKVLHRDVKPKNIMICENNGTKQLKLIDFGAAYAAELDGITRELLLVYSFGYSPMEQMQAQENSIYRPGPWTDVFALSATIYRMITGRPIYLSEKEYVLPIQMPELLGAQITSRQSNALMKGLARLPQDRTQSIAELRQSLSLMEETHPPRTPWILRLLKRLFGPIIRALTAVKEKTPSHSQPTYTLVLLSDHTTPYSSIPISDKLIIGRGRQLPLEDVQISHNHCIFEINNGQCTVTDLSKNRTLLNHKWLPKDIPVSVSEGDILTIGKYSFEVYSSQVSHTGGF